MNKRIALLQNKWNKDGINALDVVRSRGLLENEYVKWDKDLKIQVI